MKKIYSIIICATVMLLALQSCNSDNLTDLNVDPNNPTIVPASNLLTQAEFNLANTLAGRVMNAEWGLLMTQQWAQNEFTEDSRYEVDGNIFNGFFLTVYTSILSELNEAKALTEAADIPESIKANRIAIIDILMAYSFQVATDGFGDLPYSEALKPEEFPSPSYDDQESIYVGILTTYRDAVASIDESADSFGVGEAFFNGDMSKWKKFGNSLMLRAAMRHANKDQAAATPFIQAAVSDLITDNDDNAEFQFNAIEALANPLFIDNTINVRDDHCVSELFVETMKDMNDPRLEKFVAPNVDGEFVGMPFGLTDQLAFALKPSCSRPADLVRTATFPFVVIGAAEVNLLLAEAYAKGIVSGDASSAYEAGVRASMDWWNVESDDTDDYLTEHPYDESDFETSIGMQLWYALYMNGYEGWSENRRSGVPALEASEFAGEDIVPLKLPYPISEQTNNEANLSQVSSQFDNIVTPVWWDE